MAERPPAAVVDPDLTPVDELVWYLSHWHFSREELTEVGLELEEVKGVTARLREKLVGAGFVRVD